jgi:hypothetical protein
MVSFSFKINKKYALDFLMFHQVRSFKDGIDFIDFDCKIDLYEGDHNPQFSLFFEVFNFTIIDFQIYNMFHVKD